MTVRTGPCQRDLSHQISHHIHTECQAGDGRSSPWWQLLPGSAPPPVSDSLTPGDVGCDPQPLPGGRDEQPAVLSLEQFSVSGMLPVAEGAPRGEARSLLTGLPPSAWAVGRAWRPWGQVQGRPAGAALFSLRTPAGEWEACLAPNDLWGLRSPPPPSRTRSQGH